MQNLSFKSVLAVKPVEEAPKNNVVTSKTNQNSSNSQEDYGSQNSFQSLLNKQVQAKRTSDSSAAKSAVKSAEKSTGKPAETQQNQRVEDGDELDSNAKSVSDSHRANIDELVARLKEFQSGSESGKDELAASEVGEDDAEAEEAETIASLINAVNNLQPQEVMAQALMRAHMQPVNSGTTSESLEGQLSSDEMTLASDSVLKEMSATTLSNALSESMPQLSQAANTDLWKDTLSEKLSTADLRPQDIALEQDTGLRELDSKNMQSLENALKFLDSEKAKDNFAKEASKELGAVSGLQTQQMAQVTTTPSAQVIAQAGSSNQIMAYPGRTGWNQEISQKVVWMVGNGEQSATLTLNPPDLGPVQVVISVYNDQADAAFFSDNADVRQALEDGLDYLRESMQSSGLQLGQANINAGQQSQQSFQEMAQRQFAESAKSQPATLGMDMPATGVTIRESQGLVDTFA